MNKEETLKRVNEAIDKLPISDIDKEEAKKGLDEKTKKELNKMLKNFTDIESGDEQLEEEESNEEQKDGEEEPDTEEEEKPKEEKTQKPKKEKTPYNDRTIMKCPQCAFVTRDKIKQCPRCHINLIKWA